MGLVKAGAVSELRRLTFVREQERRIVFALGDEVQQERKVLQGSNDVSVRAGSAAGADRTHLLSVELTTPQCDCLFHQHPNREVVRRVEEVAD